MEMIETWKVDKGIELTGNRYLLCELMSQRAKQLYRRHAPAGVNFAVCAARALDQIITGQLGFVAPAILSGSRVEVSASADSILLSLFAQARLDLEKEGWAIVGKGYSAVVGISSSPSVGYEAQPFDITVQSRSAHMPFDFVIHLLGSLELLGDWHKRLYYDPTNPGLQSIDFNFEVTGQGSNALSIDCYHQRRWLRTIRFAFEAIEVLVLESACA
jgi:hypothetical protein